jgi:hypothetical protein
MLYVWVRAFGDFFGWSPDNKWRAAGKATDLEPGEAKRIFRAQQKKHNHDPKAWVKPYVPVRNISPPTDESGLILQHGELVKFGEKCRQIGKMEMKQIAEATGDAAASVAPVSTAHADKGASVHNAIAPYGAPRRNGERTRSLRKMNVTSNGNYLTTSATEQDHQKRGRLKHVGNGLYDVEQLVHLTCEGESVVWVEERIGDLLAEHVETTDLVVQLVPGADSSFSNRNRHFAVIIAFELEAERNDAVKLIRNGQSPDMEDEALIISKISAPPPTRRVVCDYISLIDVVLPIQLANAGAERGSVVRRSTRRKKPTPTKTYFDVGLVYFLDACQGATHLRVWLASRELYPSGVSDTEAVITAAGKEGHVVGHPHYQLFLRDLVQLSRNNVYIKFMLHGTCCHARIIILGPCCDHCASWTMLGILGGPSSERSLCDSADADVFGVMSDQGPVDVTMGALEKMREKLRKRVAQAAGDYRVRLLAKLEQPAYNTQISEATDLGRRICKDLKLHSPTWREEYLGQLIGAATLHCSHHSGLDVFNWARLILPDGSETKAKSSVILSMLPKARFLGEVRSRTQVR